jgi:hypothetical protein
VETNTHHQWSELFLSLYPVNLCANPTCCVIRMRASRNRLHDLVLHMEWRPLWPTPQVDPPP